LPLTDKTKHDLGFDVWLERVTAVEIDERVTNKERGRRVKGKG
jgi:hypothetical protein